MNWEWPIIIYLWVAGIAGGAYFATFLAHRLSEGAYRRAKRVAAALGVPAIILGVIMLVLDLGHPFRSWHLFVRFRPISPMSIGSWLLLLWAVLAVLLLLTWWAEDLENKKVSGGIAKAVTAFGALKPVAGVLDSVNFVFSILLIAYTGVLLTASSVPLWSSTVLLPALFVISAVSTGVAAVNLAGGLGVKGVESTLVEKLSRGSIAIEILEIIALVALLALAARATGNPKAVEAVRIMLSGALSFVFWVGVVLVGLLLPLGVEAAMMLRGVKSIPREMAVLVSLMVLVGGFALRMVIVFAGQMG